MSKKSHMDWIPCINHLVTGAYWHSCQMVFELPEVLATWVELLPLVWGNIFDLLCGEKFKNKVFSFSKKYKQNSSPWTGKVHKQSGPYGLVTFYSIMSFHMCVTTWSFLAIYPLLRHKSQCKIQPASWLFQLTLVSMNLGAGWRAKASHVVTIACDKSTPLSHLYL
jgi:hypothetical protein